MPKELKFHYMGGCGEIICSNCEHKELVTSFTHGYMDSRSGYQCQTCGKFATRERVEPFPPVSDVNYDLSIDALPLEERASRIEHLRRLLDLCERQMKVMPRNQWLSSWVPTVAECNAELRKVSQEELTKVVEVRLAFEKEYQSSLFCECGGELKREEIIFCPKCMSRKISYQVLFMT